MAVRNDFTAGEVLAAADLNDTFASKVDYALPTNAQTGTAYTFVAADAEKLTTASNGSAVTLTVPPQSSVTWGDDTVLRVVNYGAGAVTVAGGSGVTVTNTASTIAQYGAAVAIRTGSDAWTLVPFGAGEQAPSSVEYLVIGGGGGAANGGGAAGQYRNSVSGETNGGGGSAETPLAITKNTSYTITVGGGGASDVAGGPASPGSDSVLGSITASGGGGAQAAKVGGVSNGYSAAAGDTTSGGGGSGAGAAGTAGSGSTGGAGGNGLASSITGSSVTRGGGGGGGGSVTGGAGGSGGGGTGASGSGATTAGSTNTGGGGGGQWSVGNAAAGGSGVVVVRQALSDSKLIASTTGSPTVTLTASHIIYLFNSSGTIEWAA